MAITTTILLALLSTLAFVSAAGDNNVLITGDVLGTGRALVSPDATFIMQSDCNLVLYDYTGNSRGFQSDTHGRDRNCTLTLNDVGQFLIRGSRGQTIWRSTPNSGNIRGRYAAVLGPDSQVAIYGPMVWAAPNTHVSGAHSSSRSLSLAANNLLFSGEALRSESQLVAGENHRFIMQSDCNLVLYENAERAVWSTNTASNGVQCFARLGHDGELALFDDGNKILWSSLSKSTFGEYVLVLQANGQAAIFGPIVWSTATPTKPVLPAAGFSVDV